MSNIGHPEKTCSNFFLASNFVAVATRETLHVFGGPSVMEDGKRSITLNARNRKSNFIQDEVCGTTEIDDGCKDLLQRFSHGVCII